MNKPHPNSVRRRILRQLYDFYSENPLHMLSPEDLLEDGSLRREELAFNSFYLHDCGLVEMMVGYNPPLFAAIRISPSGVDVVENEAEFNRRFPAFDPGSDDRREEGLGCLYEVLEEVQAAPVHGIRKAWLLDDLKGLRDALREPSGQWNHRLIGILMSGMREYFGRDPGEFLPSLSRLATILDPEPPQTDEPAEE